MTTSWAPSLRRPATPAPGGCGGGGLAASPCLGFPAVCLQDTSPDRGGMSVESQDSAAQRPSAVSRHGPSPRFLQTTRRPSHPSATCPASALVQWVQEPFVEDSRRPGVSAFALTSLALRSAAQEASGLPPRGHRPPITLSPGLSWVPCTDRDTVAIHPPPGVFL